MENNTPEQQSIGRFMIIGMWVVGLALGVLLVNRHLEESRNPNNEVVSSMADGKRSIELKRSRYGQYLVTGAINNQKIDLLVDTGASSVSIPAEFADRIGLKRGAPITISTANGLSTAYQTRINRLQIGDLEVRNATAHINPGLSDEVLLGMSVLKKLRTNTARRYLGYSRTLKRFSSQQTSSYAEFTVGGLRRFG